jgi:hypothetical protein
LGERSRRFLRSSFRRAGGLRGSLGTTLDGAKLSLEAIELLGCRLGFPARRGGSLLRSG